jgi:hypothetical protein
MKFREWDSGHKSLFVSFKLIGIEIGEKKLNFFNSISKYKFPLFQIFR